MRKTSLVYIKCQDKYLMLYRNKKKNDLNAGKWVGVGGKFEDDETPEQCARREIFEETGIEEVELEYLGLVKFISDVWEDEDMYLFKGIMNDFPKEFESNEGDLAWIDEDKVMDLPMWEGDRVFLPELIEDKKDINYTLVYKSEDLVEVIKN